MLILSRYVQESIILHTDEGLKITILVTDYDRGQIKLGIDAPKGVHIDRKEIWLRKQAEKAAS